MALSLDRSAEGRRSESEREIRGRTRARLVLPTRDRRLDLVPAVQTFRLIGFEQKTQGNVGWAIQL